MKVQLKNIGRGKFNGIVDVEKSSDILKEVSKHLMSSCIELEWVTENKANVIVGGFRAVGEVEILDGLICQSP